MGDWESVKGRCRNKTHKWREKERERHVAERERERERRGSSSRLHGGVAVLSSNFVSLINNHSPFRTLSASFSPSISSGLRGTIF
jgi:hypothetical protein